MEIPKSMVFKDFAFGYLTLYDENMKPLNPEENPPALSLGFKAKGIEDNSDTPTEYLLTGVLNAGKDTLYQLVWQGLNGLMSESSAESVMNVISELIEDEQQKEIPTTVELQMEIAQFEENGHD